MKRTLALLMLLLLVGCKDVDRRKIVVRKLDKRIVVKPVEVVELPIVEEVPKTETVIREIKLVIGANFDFDKDLLLASDIKEINDFIDLIVEKRDLLDERYKTGTMIITGHTDSWGTLEYNDDLGMRRATRVFDYFNENLDLSKFEDVLVESKGERELLRVENTSQDRFENRRVEVLFREKYEEVVED